MSLFIQKSNECFLCWKVLYLESENENNICSEKDLENYTKYIRPQLLEKSVDRNQENESYTGPNCLCSNCYNSSKKLSAVNDILESVQKELSEIVETLNNYITDSRNGNDKQRSNSVVEEYDLGYIESAHDDKHTPDCEEEFSPESNVQDLGFESNETIDSTPLCDKITIKQNFPTPLPDGGKSKSVVNPFDLDCRIILERIDDSLHRGRVNVLQSKNIQFTYENNVNSQPFENDNEDSPHFPERELCVADSAGDELSIGDGNDVDIKDVIVEVDCNDEIDDCSDYHGLAEQELSSQCTTQSTLGTKSAYTNRFDKDIRIVLSRVNVNRKPKEEKRCLRPRRSTGIAKLNSEPKECIIASNREKVQNDSDSDFVSYESDDTECSNENEVLHEEEEYAKEAIIAANSKKEYLCSLCDKSYFHKWDLKRHIREVHDQVPLYSCKVCDVNLKRKDRLIRHMKTVHSVEFNYPCDKCSENFKHSTELKEHQRTHDAERFLIENDKVTHYQCSACDQSFKKEDSQHFVDHMLFHKNESRKRNLFICQVCEETFATKLYLEEHNMEKHFGRFPCKICGKQLISYRGLREHIERLHNGIGSDAANIEAPAKNVTCDPDIMLDGKTGNGTEALRKKAGFIYPCRECPKKFNFQYKLTHHLRKMHPEKIDVTLSYRFKCKKCRRKFRTSDGCKLHQMKMHGGDDKEEETEDKHERHICSLCGKSLCNKRVLRRHKEAMHSDTPLYPCTICDVSFKYKMNLNRHVTLVHSTEFNFPCGRCDEKFKLSGQLKKHQRIHVAERVLIANDKGTHFQCGVCDQSFKKEDSEYFVDHMWFHENENPLKCKICEERFATKVYLEEHYKENHYDGFPCKLCGSKLSSFETLQAHIKNGHTTNEKFICEQCGATLKTKQLLRDHVLIHGEKYLPCRICGKKFNSRIYRHIHIRDVHNKGATVTCEYCGMSCRNSTGYKMHVRSHTGEKPFGCNLCQEKFDQKVKLNVHKSKLHNIGKLICKTCGKEFNKKNNLDLHMRVHTGEKPYGCNLCDKRFDRMHNFTTHMRFHTGEKPYKCPNAKCGKSFSRKDNLNVHVRKCQNK